MTARAEWRATLQHAGFFGKVSGGAIWASRSGHEVETSIGMYDIANVHYGQLNLAYRYTPFEQPAGPDIVWEPTQVGLFVIHSQESDRFFSESPSKYPTSGYYDQTAFRGGIEIGTRVVSVPWNFAFAYRFRVLDTGLVALYNNAHRDLQYYISSGIQLQYIF